MSIHVHYQNVKFQISGSAHIKRWLTYAIREEGKSMGKIDYFFIDENSQREINSEFLEHHYNTDVITFDYSADKVISGEVYIAIETVRSNSIKYNTNFRQEYLRVMLHGVLHLLGLNDKTEEERLVMKEKEEYYLRRF